MLPILFILLLGIPIAELYVIVRVSDGIGFLNTLALLVLISAAGAWLLKQQGLRTWTRLQQALARGQVPAREVTDGAMIVVGGALLLTPGFLTDAAGLVLLLPPTRAALKGATRRLLRRMAERRFVPPGGRRVYRAKVVRSQRRDATRPTSPEPPSHGPPPEFRHGEGDSRDTE